MNLEYFSDSLVGYLYYAHLTGWKGLDIGNNQIIGDDWHRSIRRFEPEKSYKSQLNWHISKSEENNYLDEIG